MPDDAPAHRIDPSLLELLACPACDHRPPVRLTERGLRCDACGRTYPLTEHWPEMLVEKAILDDDTGPDAAVSKPGAD